MSQTEAAGTGFTTKESIAEAVDLCFGNEDTFYQNSKQLIEGVKKKDKTVISVIIEKCLNALSNPETKPKSRFLALYLIKQCMETRTPEFVLQVDKKVLSTIVDIARAKETYFPPKTSKTLMTNFTQLILECIYFWGHYFGQDAKKKTLTPFGKAYAELSQELKFPEKFMFFKDKSKKKADTIQSQTVEKKEQLPENQTKSAIETKPKEQMPEKIEVPEPDPKKFSTAQPQPEKKHTNPVVRAVEDCLAKIDTNKEYFLDNLMPVEGPPDEVFNLFLPELLNANKELQEYVEPVLALSFPGQEQMVERMTSNIGMISQVQAEFNNYKAKKLTAQDLKTKVIELFMGASDKTAHQLASGLQIKEQKKVSSDAEMAQASKKDIQIEQPKQEKTTEQKAESKIEPKKGIQPKKVAKPKEESKQKTEEPAPKQASKTSNQPQSKGGFDFDFKKVSEESHSSPTKRSAFDEFEEIKEKASAKSDKGFTAFDEFSQSKKPIQPEKKAVSDKTKPVTSKTEEKILNKTEKSSRGSGEESERRAMYKIHEGFDVDAFPPVEEVRGEESGSGSGFNLEYGGKKAEHDENFEPAKHTQESKANRPAGKHATKNIPFDSPFEKDHENLIPPELSGNRGDYESERLRIERDRIMAELEKIRRDYNALMVDYQYMKNDNNAMHQDMARIKEELDRMKKLHATYSKSNEELKRENEAYKKLRETLASENENHLRRMEDLNREIIRLKERIADYDTQEKRAQNDFRVKELESVLRTTEEQYNMMQEIFNKVAADRSLSSEEIQKIRQINFTELALELTRKVQDVLRQNWNYIAPPQTSAKKEVPNTSASREQVIVEPKKDISVTDAEPFMEFPSYKDPIVSGTLFATELPVRETIERARQARLNASPFKLSYELDFNPNPQYLTYKPQPDTLAYTEQILKPKEYPTVTITQAEETKTNKSPEIQRSQESLEQSGQFRQVAPTLQIRTFSPKGDRPVKQPSTPPKNNPLGTNSQDTGSTKKTFHRRGGSASAKKRHSEQKQPVPQYTVIRNVEEELRKEDQLQRESERILRESKSDRDKDLFIITPVTSIRSNLVSTNRSPPRAGRPQVQVYEAHDDTLRRIDEQLSKSKAKSPTQALSTEPTPFSKSIPYNTRSDQKLNIYQADMLQHKQPVLAKHPITAFTNGIPSQPHTPIKSAPKMFEGIQTPSTIVNYNSASKQPISAFSSIEFDPIQPRFTTDIKERGTAIRDRSPQVQSILDEIKKGPVYIEQYENKRYSDFPPPLRSPASTVLHISTVSRIEDSPSKESMVKMTKTEYPSPNINFGRQEYSERPSTVSSQLDSAKKVRQISGVPPVKFKAYAD